MTTPHLTAPAARTRRAAHASGRAGRQLLIALCAWGFIGAAAQAEEPPATADNPPSVSADGPPADPSLGADIKAYFTAPLHWQGSDWAFFGGSLAAIAVARHYDSQVRTHFIAEEGPGVGKNSEDLADAIPTVAVLGLTWLYAGIIDNSAGRREAWEMLEAAGLSATTAYALKFAAGRETPYQTSDPSEWFKSGSSFPSLHATAAFAVGTVLAESGNDEYRWLRRVLGYGLGAATSYERLRHNAHWLSDVVAGAALGSASARFTLNRHEGAGLESHLALVPVEGGALLTYRITLP